MIFLEDLTEKFNLLFAPVSTNSTNIREAWILQSTRPVLGFWKPYLNEGKVVSNIFPMASRYLNTHYSVESAYSGQDEIYNALKKNKCGLDFYADLLVSGKLLRAIKNSQFDSEIKEKLRKICG